MSKRKLETPSALPVPDATLAKMMRPDDLELPPEVPGETEKRILRGRKCLSWFWAPHHLIQPPDAAAPGTDGKDARGRSIARVRFLMYRMIGQWIRDACKDPRQTITDRLCEKFMSEIAPASIRRSHDDRVDIAVVFDWNIGRETLEWLFMTNEDARRGFDEALHELADRWTYVPDGPEEKKKVDGADENKEEAALEHRERRVPATADGPTLPDRSFPTDVGSMWAVAHADKAPSVYRVAGFTPDDILLEPVPVLAARKAGQWSAVVDTRWLHEHPLTRQFERAPNHVLGAVAADNSISIGAGSGAGVARAAAMPQSFAWTA